MSRRGPGRKIRVHVLTGQLRQHVEAGRELARDQIAETHRTEDAALRLGGGPRRTTIDAS